MTAKSLVGGASSTKLGARIKLAERAIRATRTKGANYEAGADLPSCSHTLIRHTNLLIQQQQELTAGLLELYKRVVNRQGWDGAPVEEVEGIPSVHGILQRLGILDDGDEVGEMTPSNSRLNRETISQLAAAGTHPVSTIIAPNLSEAPAPAQLSPKRPAEEHQLMHAPMPTGLDLVPPGPMAGFEDPAQFGVFPQFPSPPWEYSPSEYSPWEYTLEAGWVWSALV